MSWKSSTFVNIVQIGSRIRMKPNAIKILCICGDIHGHVLRSLAYKRLSTLLLLAQPRPTFVDSVARSFLPLPIGTLGQSI